MTRLNTLPELTTPASADTFAVEDTDANVTKHITYANIVGNVSITASQVSDFDTEVANNSAVAANTAKISFDSTSSARLANTSGTNTGDQDLSGKQDNITLTTTGTSGAATLVGATLNIPQYTGGGGGDVSKVGTPADNQVGVWTGDGTIEGTAGLTYDGSAFGITGNITVSGTVDGRDLATDGSKLDGIEAGADVTDTTNVTAAGALMDSEVDADIKTLSLPANTTISTFGASLVDDADAATARATLGTIEASGVAKITVGTTEPTSPATGDLWIDTN